jgi:phospholipid/cholesterol/gamma-HCH transport system ATP-binding protein
MVASTSRAPDHEAIIRVEGLTAAYGDEVVLDDLSFEVYRGEVFVILWGSGCGKSTLLRHMIGLHEPVAGRIWLDGMDVGSTGGADRMRLLRKIGVTYQSGALFGSMSLIENVRLPLEEFTALRSDAIELIARMKLQLVGLTGYAERMPAELSGGMRKRGAIARAMALDPAILFLDEPSAGLDPITSAELDELILRLARSLGITFVVVSHELASIDAIADRAIMLDKRVRRIVAMGPPRELREKSEDPWVRQFFSRQAAPSGGVSGERLEKEDGQA